MRRKCIGATKELENESKGREELLAVSAGALETEGLEEDAHIFPYESAQGKHVGRGRSATMDKERNQQDLEPSVGRCGSVKCLHHKCHVEKRKEEELLLLCL